MMKGSVYTTIRPCEAIMASTLNPARRGKAMNEMRNITYLATLFRKAHLRTA